jgi:hypothetical protein
LSTSPYDVSIWEEIRPIVRRKTYQLVESINKEIPKDPSLGQFQGKYPVPFQLREIMEQRANAWVQRLYDLCCDAYKSHGKTLSADFDRAVWEYCLEPFIMGETDSQIHDQTMGGFLNLLLCAVGSPPEKRPSLKVGQKQCCFDVRAKVYQTWYDKLHHLPPRMNEAVAALARFNAMERRAASIVRGLPPDDPPPPPSIPAHPLAQPEESLPPRAFNSNPKTPPSTIEPATDIGPALSNETEGTIVSASPPLSPAQEVPEKEARGVSGVDMPTQPSGAEAATWDAIEIRFLSDERVQIRNGATTETRNYTELGFEDGRNGKPNRAWEAFRVLATERGIIRDAGKTGRTWPKVEKRMQEIRKVLRKHFHISADPVPFVEGTGYQALFKINCRPSFDT